MISRHKEGLLISAGILIVFAASFLLAYQRAHAQAVFDLRNELVDASQATNRSLRNGATIGHTGYVVVGTGEYDAHRTGMTIKSPVPNIKVRFIHGNQCRSMSPGSYSAVDSPYSDTAMTTTFIVVDKSTRNVFTPGNQPAILTGANNCTTLDLDTGVLDLERFPDGTYGGLIGVQLNTSSTRSQQNSFRVMVLDSAGNQLESADVGFNPEIADRMQPVLAPFGITAADVSRLEMSITNTDQEFFGITDFGLPFHIVCESTRDNFTIPLDLYDVDKGIWQDVNVTYGSITKYVPDVNVVLEESSAGANSWTPIGLWVIDGNGGVPGDVGNPGNAGMDTITNFGPFKKNMDYRVRVNNVYRANALSFGVNSKDLETVENEVCTPPAPTCTAISAPAVVSVGQTFNVSVTLRNNSTSNIGSGDRNNGFHLGILNAAGQNPPDNPNGAQWQPINSVTNLVARYDELYGGQTYQRMPISAGIAGGGGQTTYTFSVTAPSTAVNNKYLGVQILDRTNSRWAGLDAACVTNVTVATAFNLSSQPQVPVLNDTETPTSATFTAPIGFSGAASSVGGVSTTRDFFFNRGGTYNGAAGTVTGGATSALGASIAQSVTVSSKPLDAVLGSVARGGIPAVQAGDLICVRLSVSPASGFVNASGAIVSSAGSSTRVQCEVVLSKPYFKVYGGDVLAGVGFGGTCPTVNSSVIGFAKQSGTDWVGSGGQMAVFTSGNGTIRQFATYMLAAPSMPTSRAFANTLVSGTTFGTGYGASFCADDFWSNQSPSLTTTAGAAPALNALATGQYKYNSGVNLTSVAPVGNKIAIYVDGDVNITGAGITTSTAWASYNAIASVYVVARGNIYIAPTVTQLDGIYVAMPRVPATTTGTPTDGGRIFTCTDNGATPTAATLANNCGNRLLVNGAMVSTHLNLLRTRGSLRAATSVEAYTSANIAEVFRYVPEMFINTPAGEPRIQAGPFDSVTSLPPTL